MVNGTGLAMGTMDTINYMGGTPSQTFLGCWWTRTNAEKLWRNRALRVIS